MTVYSYVSKTTGQGGWSGVCRFSAALKSAFPGILETTGAGAFCESDLVVADNHLSLSVPEAVETVVVHHGCAEKHFERDVAWRTEQSAGMVSSQRRMFDLANRKFVAPGEWVALQFCGIHPRGFECEVVPHWVEPIPALPRAGKPKIIGDWRDHNKGSGVWRAIAARCPDWDFQPLRFRDDVGRRRQYGEASLYLCLSLSEGGPYAVCDAEAAELPIVTTNVGNHLEFDDCEVISWQDRDNVDCVIAALERKLKLGRRRPSFYREYTFERWKNRWEALIQ